MHQTACLPHYKENELKGQYTLAACPEESIRECVFMEMEDVKRMGLRTKETGTEGLLPFATFWVNENLEHTVCKWITRICSKKRSFNLSLNNFSATPNGTLHIRVTNPSPFFQLITELAIVDQYIKSNGYAPVSFNRAITLPVVCEIKEPFFRSVMMHYSQKTFSASCKISRLLLLKSTALQEKASVVNVFNLIPSGR